MLIMIMRGKITQLLFLLLVKSFIQPKLIKILAQPIHLPPLLQLKDETLWEKKKLITMITRSNQTLAKVALEKLNNKAN